MATPFLGEKPGLFRVAMGSVVTTIGPYLIMEFSSKPSDGPSCGRTIGFIAQKAKGRWARGVLQQPGRIQSARDCLGWRVFAPAKGQAGAGRFVDGQIRQE
jgi:hypothetical protein